MLAYGISVPELKDGAGPGSVRDVPWHTVRLAQRRGHAPVYTTENIGEAEASLHVRGLAAIAIERAAMAVTITAPSPLPRAALVHPVLAFVGAVVARWTGRSAFHAASVILDGRAWVLLGAVGGGKTTLASMLHATGAAVMADDLTVVDGGTVLAGPRSGDLRESAAARLGRGRKVDVHVGRDRWRENFGPVPLEAPLAGFIELGWGDELRLEALTSGERLGAWGLHEAFALPPTAHRGFLDLLPLPMYRLARPKDWSQDDEAIALLRQTARDAAS